MSVDLNFQGECLLSGRLKQGVELTFGWLVFAAQLAVPLGTMSASIKLPSNGAPLEVEINF